MKIKNYDEENIKTMAKIRISEIEETIKLYDLGIAERKVKRKKLMHEIKTLELNKNKLKKRKQDLELKLAVIEVN